MYVQGLDSSIKINVAYIYIYHVDMYIAFILRLLLYYTTTHQYMYIKVAYFNLWTISICM